MYSIDESLPRKYSLVTLSKDWLTLPIVDFSEKLNGYKVEKMRTNFDFTVYSDLIVGREYENKLRENVIIEN